MHPATLGQLLDRLAQRELVNLTPDPGDRRRRVLREAPLAGPVRLRQTEADSARLRDLTAALDDAIELFGLEDYAR
jgi:DNA-binding MarR family transcriptional regulator